MSACVAAVAAAAGPARAQGVVESAAAAGLIHTNTAPQNPAELEFMGAGAAAADLDRDGDQDLYAIGGRAGVDRLFLNNGDGTFVEIGAQAGVAFMHRGSGVAAGDVDRDGDLDLYVTSFGPAERYDDGFCKLLINNGDLTFTDEAAARGVSGANGPGDLGGRDPYSPAFGDYDGDGDLDLFVAGWMGGNRLYRNDGAGFFADVTASAIVDGGLGLRYVHGFVPRFVDIDRDGHTDLLLVADFSTSRLYLNDGKNRLIDHTDAWGAGLDSNGMGSAVFDADNDGDLDWYVPSRITHDQSSGSGNMLYLQREGGGFDEVSEVCRVNNGAWSWGTDAQDFNHDGWADILVTNGWISPWHADRTRLFLSDAPGPDEPLRFTDTAQSAGLHHTSQGRGVLTLDADRDGDRDMVIVTNGGPLAYYRNDMPPPGSAFLDIALVTSAEPGLAPDGVGSLVRVTAHGRSKLRSLDGGSNFLSQSELSAHFGFPQGGIAERVEILWADGRATTLRNVPLDVRLVVTARFACPADWNADGALALADAEAFVAEFTGTAGYRHPQTDLDGDGALTFADVAAFIAAFNAGCQ